MAGSSPFPPPGGVAAAPATASPQGPQQQPGTPVPVREKVPSSSRQLKPGTLLVYADDQVSPEEKRAKLAQYASAVNAPAQPALVADAASSFAAAGSDSPAAGAKKRARAEDLMG